MTQVKNRKPRVNFTVEQKLDYVKLMVVMALRWIPVPKPGQYTAHLILASAAPLKP